MVLGNEPSLGESVFLSTPDPAEPVDTFECVLFSEVKLLFGACMLSLTTWEGMGTGPALFPVHTKKVFTIN